MNDKSGVVVLTTVGTVEEARSLAEAIVKQRLAGCVNVVERIRSTYWWQGSVNREDESLLVIKTLAVELDALESFIEQNHPYDVPEFIVLPIGRMSSKYASWLEETRK